MATAEKRPLYQGKKVTFGEYQTLKYDGFQYEIMEGVMKMTPAPFFRHQRLLGYLHIELGLFLRKNPNGIVTIAPRDVKFNEQTTYQPDILYISKDRLKINTKAFVDGPPDYIAEVLSKGTISIDVRKKFIDYEKYGVKEYWIMNPDDVYSSEYYYLLDGQYEQFEPENNVVKSKVIEGFEINLEELEKSLNPFGIMNS